MQMDGPASNTRKSNRKVGDSQECKKVTKDNRAEDKGEEHERKNFLVCNSPRTPKNKVPRAIGRSTPRKKLQLPNNPFEAGSEDIRNLLSPGNLSVLSAISACDHDYGVHESSISGKANTASFHSTLDTSVITGELSSCEGKNDTFSLESTIEWTPTKQSPCVNMSGKEAASVNAGKNVSNLQEAEVEQETEVVLKQHRDKEKTKPLADRELKELAEMENIPNSAVVQMFQQLLNKMEEKS